MSIFIDKNVFESLPALYDFLLALAFYCRPGFPNLQFNFLTSKEGLSNNEVSHITQDKEDHLIILRMV